MPLAPNWPETLYQRSSTRNRHLNPGKEEPWWLEPLVSMSVESYRHSWESQTTCATLRSRHWMSMETAKGMQTVPLHPISGEVISSPSFAGEHHSKWKNLIGSQMCSIPDCSNCYISRRKETCNSAWGVWRCLCVAMQEGCCRPQGALLTHVYSHHQEAAAMNSGSELDLRLLVWISAWEQTKPFLNISQSQSVCGHDTSATIPRIPQTRCTGISSRVFIPTN